MSFFSDVVDVYKEAQPRPIIDPCKADVRSCKKLQGGKELKNWNEVIKTHIPDHR